MLGECGTNMAMTRRYPRKPRPALDPSGLDQLALRYVERFATTRTKLRRYLQRKILERGWSGSQDADVDVLVDRFVSLGYVDDAAYAASKARSLTARGYGVRRVRSALGAAGVAEDDSVEAWDVAATNAVDAALKFARKRRIGPFGSERLDPASREKALAAMVRAGHTFALAKAILDIGPGGSVDVEALEAINYG